MAYGRHPNINSFTYQTEKKTPTEQNQLMNRYAYFR